MVVFFGTCLYAQSERDLVNIVNQTNTQELKKLRTVFHQEYLERESRIENFLAHHPDVKRSTKEGASIREIYDVLESGEILYYGTSNDGSSKTARANRLYLGGTLGLNVQGQGMKAIVWDGGNARKTHVEFPGNKVVNIDGNTPVDHATHVTGTIVAKGITANLRGIAFDAIAHTYNWNDDYTEMADEAASGLLVSNHSYWIGSQLTLPEHTWQMGAYDTRASQFDALAFAAPYYLAVTAAGNDRNDNTAPLASYIASKEGYNLLRGMQNAKNYLAVGAVYNVSNYTSESSVIMSEFSSWGPTDDGRIKPDVVAKGVSVKSTLATSDTASGNLQGTSMASPAVAGVALLLQQHYYNTNASTYMRAATLKGLINHTADEAGRASVDPNEVASGIGPDYRFGWGLINAEKAATLITDKAANAAIIDELVLNNNATYSTTVTVSGNEPLMVSISWTDKQATANNGTNDPVNADYLINDLDVRVTKNNVTYFPWTLNPAMPSADAVRTSDNFRDNFEKIQVDNASGTYTITVSHKGTLDGGLQNFSLIASGEAMTLDAEDFVANNSALNIFPNPTSNTLNFDTNNWNEISNIVIVDVTGKVINAKYDLNQKSIDVSNLQAGVYFVKFASEDKMITKKFIKK